MGKTLFKEGDKFNRLTIIRFSHNDKHHRKHFVVKCECGNEKIVQGSLMSSGNTKSCGCLSYEVKKSKKFPNNRGVIYQIILGYKRHAKRRGYNWRLSLSQVSDIIQKPCYYCGAKKSNKKITKNCKEGFFYNGIDRVDNLKDYSIDNVVPACKKCNQAKGALSKDEFISWIKAMAEQWG